VEETVRYNYRLRPGARAEAALIAEWGRCRWLWNEAVHQQKTGRKPTFAKLCKLLTEARAANAWLRDGSQVAQQQVLRTYGLAMNASYKVKGRGRPTLKKRNRTLPTLDYTTRGFSLKDGRLCLPGKVTIPVVWSRDLPSAPTSVRVFQDSLGHWYASFVVRREQVESPEATAGIGIDWGVTTTATTSDPAFDLPHHGFRKRCAAELAKVQRKMARRAPQRGHASSKGYQRAKRQAAKLHKKAARQNQHTARQWAKAVVDNHQTIAVEDFKPKFLARTTMARKAADAAIGATKRELIERGMRAGRKVVLVPPAYTTMTCSGCFARAKRKLELHERIFVCTSCGLCLGRDENAARVILATVESDRAGVDGVRHAIAPFGVRLDAA
jgi:putative transposase